MSDIEKKLNELKVDELKIIARKLGLKGYSKQNKKGLIENITKNKEEKEILKALDIGWWDKYLNHFYGIASVISLIIGVIFYYCPYSPSSDDPIPLVPVHSKPDETICYDSITISEAEKFYKSLNAKSLFDLIKLSGFSKNPDIKYNGKLIKDSNGNITGEMRFSHKESPNIFALKNDGSIYPSDGETQIVNSIEFIWIPDGEYKMGCDDEACGEIEKPGHTECVNGFWMGKYEVTQAQWDNIMNPQSESDDDKPKTNISWKETQEFIDRLNEKNPDKTKKFRLPTEAEWEYACQQNHSEIKGLKNEVWEWCEDTYRINYNEKADNPSLKTVRGSSYFPEKFLRCTYRTGMSSNAHAGYIGFRLVSHQIDQ